MIPSLPLEGFVLMGGREKSVNLGKKTLSLKENTVGAIGCIPLPISPDVCGNGSGFKCP